MTTMSNIEFRRMDLAYVDYNVALNILVDLIPRNKEYPTFAYQSGDPFAKYKALQKVCQMVKVHVAHLISMPGSLR